MFDFHHSDPFGQVDAHFHELPGGVVQRTDAMGHLQSTFHPYAGGGGYWADALGHTTHVVREIGGHVQTLTPTGQLMSTHLQIGGATHTLNPFGQLTERFDPMTGNVTNALGMLKGRYAGG